MKNIFLTLFVVLLTAFAFCMNACTNAQAKQNRSDDDIKEEVARRVKEIYDTVIPWYNSHEGDIRSVNDFDERFLSKDMQMMGAQVGAILRELHEKGEDDIPPGYDYDHWVMGQDWENLSIRTDSIRVLSPDTAEAYMCITNCGYPQKFMLMMTRDGREWFIDDFRQYDEQAKGFAISDKRNIQDYINENPPSASEESLDSVYLYPDERAMFPGGDAACQEWLRDRVRYPADCQREKLEGRVLVTFVVRYNGIITDAKVVQKVDPRLEEEALHAIRNMPKWIPARMKGKAVSSRYTIPVRFALKEMRKH